MSVGSTAVLFVDSAEAIGGAEVSLLLLMRHLDRRRFCPVLVCNEGPLAEAARRQRLDIRVVAMPKLRGRPTAPRVLAQAVMELRRIIREERIEIVHCNVMRASFYAALAARMTGRRLIWHARDIHRARWYPRLMCHLATRTIAVSKAVAARVPCPQRTAIVYNGLDPAPFAEANGQAFRAEIGVGPNQPLIGIVGRIWPWKGQRLFLETAARIGRSHPAARFCVVGDVLFPADRDYLAELKAYARRLGISDRVVFTGHRHDVATVMAGFDLLVHTSQGEPFGRVLIEAMAARRPVVAFADGGVPEIVVDGQTGVLTPPGDVSALVEAIEQLLGDGNRRAAMGQAGRDRVAELFTAEGMTRATEAVYDSLVT
jgi:glycosyltransferase involved in cell wall biosynthesis